MRSCLRAPHRFQRPLPLLALLALLALSWPGRAAAQAASEPSAASLAARGESARAGERCEASVAETLRKMRGAEAYDVQFVAAQRVVAPTDDVEIGVKGAGRYRAASGRGGNSFTFSCSFNTRTAQTSAVVLREAGGGPGARAEPPFQPDLSRISPEACESAVAQALKQKHPRVAHIAMEPDTRRLQPGPDERIVQLLGHGAVQRAPGMNAVPFSYTCDVDARSGRVVSVRTSV